MRPQVREPLNKTEFYEAQEFINAVSNADVSFIQPHNSGLNEKKILLRPISEQKKEKTLSFQNVEEVAGRVELVIGDLSNDTSIDIRPFKV